ncbi:major capsid protein, partial [Devosia sp.]|uniref:major capsid protein n=1 Tax=Devosia sp. TaxID=1871048 RepID=UPI001AD3001D
MSLSQMQVFNKYIMPATIETLAQLVDKFNGASGGAIRLTTEGFEGDFLQESFYAAIHSARRRVDRYATNANSTPTDLTQLKHSSVKVAGGFGPVRFEPSQMTWLNKPTAEGVEVASRNFAEALLQDQLNTA